MANKVIPTAPSAALTAPRPKPRRQPRRSRLGGMKASFAGIMSVRDTDNPLHKRIIDFVDGRPVTIVMTVFTMYALFGDDFRLAVCPPSVDPVFFSLSAIALGLFTIELILNSIAKADYVLRFYFWLDLIATVSLIPDIGWIWDPIVGTNSSTDDADAATALQAGRASRAGTRAGRIVRIVRLVRLIRIVKLYKHVKKHESEENVNEPSHVGKRLADLTTRRLIILVLAMVIILPLFRQDAFEDDVDKYQTWGLSAIHRKTFSSTSGTEEMRAHLTEYVQESGDLLNLTLYSVDATTMDSWLRDIRFLDGDTYVETSPSTEWNYDDLVPITTIATDYRDNEVGEVNIYGCYHANGTLMPTETVCRSRAFFSKKDATVFEAAMNILKTVFVMLILAIGALMFTKIAETLVIGPIERMVNLVKQLANDPLATVQHNHPHHAPGAEVGYETLLLERTLVKIGGLLQIGFGEAGTEIISSNMRNGGTLNPLIAGRKMNGIFGFCDIRQFTDATECLQEEVMVFVNEIADIVHVAIHQYHGAANKNIGDAFLLVWRLPEHEDVSQRNTVVKFVTSPAPGNATRANAGMRTFLPGGGSGLVVDGEVEESKDEPVGELSETQLADNALFAFLKCTVDIHHANVGGSLHKYHNDPRLMERFQDGYSVRMGYGLHRGWAIEGAIGSALKIDASYLSPNVNMASRLEAATKQYGAPLLMSGPFVECLSPAAQEFCRQLDCVTVKGSAEPVKLFTFDVTDIPDRLGASHSQSSSRFVANFADDPNIGHLQRSVHPEFLKTFRQAVAQYVDGAWETSVQTLQQCLELKPGDGPSKTLLRVMAKTNNAPPSGWQGVRALTEK